MSETKKIISNINLIDIKSIIILKKIFSILHEKQKLNLIINNKRLQKLFFIDIKDYKQISGKYKIIEKDGKGKEYILDTKIVIFEGDYINKKRNGKGKEYNDKSQLIFEGEYFNGKRKGLGKEYNLGELIFQGEYLNGKRNGKGKRYYDNGKILFEGEYLNGKIWNGKGYNEDGKIDFEINNGKGIVKEYYFRTNKLKFLEFEGEYINGERNGKGKEYFSEDNLEYEGEYLNGKRHGHGKEYDDFGELLYEGEYFKGQRHGKGKGMIFYLSEDDIEFEGEYLNGKIWKGIGRKYYDNGKLNGKENFWMVKKMEE